MASNKRSNKAVKVTLQFNKRLYTFTKAQLESSVKKGVRAALPHDASHLLHRVKLPGVKYPVSLQWSIYHLLEVPPQMVAVKSGMIRGSYHPQQALAALTKLGPLGVSVESDSPRLRYGPWLTKRAKQTLADNQRAAELANKRAQRKSNKSKSKSGKSKASNKSK